MIPDKLKIDGLKFIKLQIKSKKPLEKWSELYYSYNNPTFIEHIKINLNYGIILGNGLLVIDADTNRLDELIKNNFPETFTVKTKNGNHYYYTCAEFKNKRVLKDKNGHMGEIQYKGQYVVGPGSIHPSGVSYEVYKNIDICVIDNSFIKNQLGKYYTSLSINKEVILDGTETGLRNDSMFKLACLYREKDLSINETLRILKTHNEKNIPPLSNNELNKIIESAFRYTNKSYPSLPLSTSIYPILPNSTLKEKKEKREGKIKLILSSKRPEIKQLKCGLHNGVFYYGTILYEDKKYYQCVLTDDREIYVNWGESRNEIKEDFGLFYRYNFEWEVLDNLWSVESIKKFLYDEEKVELKEVYNCLVKTNKNYMYYPNELTHSILALDIISTYFLPLFEAIGRTFFEAERGSGKTRQCQIMKLLCFNSIMSADISKSSFFRIMESTCGTLIIDDFDSINPEQKMDILQHYKTGYKNSSKSVRTGEGKNRKIESFRNYGHVVMNNTTGLDDISSDRSKFIPILKVDGKITTKNIDFNNPIWLNLSGKLYICGLCNAQKVKIVYDNCQSKITGRKFEISRPILSIAKLIDFKLKDDIEEYLTELFDRTDFVDTENDWEYLGLELFYDKEDKHKVQLKDITKTVAEKTLDITSKDFKSRKRGLSIYLGKMFKRIPVFKTGREKGVAYVKLLSKVGFEKYMKLKYNENKVDRVDKGRIGSIENEYIDIDKVGVCSTCTIPKRWLIKRNHAGKEFCQDCVGISK